MVAEEYLSDDDVMDHEEVSKVLFNLKPNIEVILEEYDEWYRLWKQSLIVKLLGKKLSLQIMKRWANRRWTKNGTTRVMDLEGDFFSDSIFGSGGPWICAF
ncbi:hypothetical protein AHAS_Ahas02G0178900 [Arachis hypogaea]